METVAKTASGWKAPRKRRVTRSKISFSSRSGQLRRRGVGAEAQARGDVRQLGELVGADVAGVGARVGEHLVALVQGLGDLEAALGGEAEALVRLALQAGEVVELGRLLALALAVHLAHQAQPARHAVSDGLGLSLGEVALGRLEAARRTGARAVGASSAQARPFPVGLAVWPLGRPGGLPALAVGAASGEGGPDLPEVARDEVVDGLLAVAEHGQGGGLHAPQRS
jgi:hypothetical protein